MISLLTSTAIAQNFETGSYLVSGGRIIKMDLVKRRNESFKVSILTTGGEKVYAFYPLKNNEGSYASKEDNLVLTKMKGVLVLLELDPKGAIENKFVVGLSRKDIKKGRKTLGIKSDFFNEFINNSNKKESRYLPEFYVKNPTSKFHQENVGRIVFFSEKPTVGQEDLSKIKTDFKVGDNIWAVAYLPLSLRSGYLYKLSNYSQDIYGNMNYWACVGIDKFEKDMLPKENEIVNQTTVKTLYEKDLDKNYIIFQLLTDRLENSEVDSDGVEFLMKRINERMGSYKHKLRIALTNGRMDSDKEYFHGYINFDASEGTEIYKEMSSNMAQKILDAKPLPIAVREDVELEAEMLQQVRIWARNKNWSNVDFRKAIITLDWQVIKDDYGNIEGKYIEGNILYKSNEGCGYRNFGFIRKYLGSSKYDKNLRQYTTGPVGALSCDKIE
ncbi:hypothetical protein [Aureivirga sp. CE67]|uniref:hypothetical protein n=1 Tax=Aureivirga sp. CE67 TaxID=1788983 RepID=UPI0018CBC47F|nr:hypothetical protein [Aureivirga sp. CE67]